MSYEKFWSQELIPGAGYRVENERNVEEPKEHFQISVNILEGQKLAISSPATASFYIILGIDKVKYRTAVRKGYEKPYFGEQFTFEMYTSASELRKSNLWLAAMEIQTHSTPLLFGEASVSLGTVWAQPSHQIVQKWAELRRPHGKSAARVGYLKIDVHIIPKYDSKVAGAVTEDLVKHDLLLSKEYEQQQALFIIKVFNGFGLSSNSRRRGQNPHKKPPNLFVRVSFSGLVVNTSTRKGSIHPCFNEKVSIVEMFPNLNHKVTFEVYSVEDDCLTPIARTYLSLTEISYGGENGFLPTFGPSLLHMYGPPETYSNEKLEENGPYYRGALVISLETVVPYYEQYLRTIDLEPCLNTCLENNWLIEDFCIFCPIFETSMLDPRIVTKCCGVAITIGELPYDISPENEEAQGKRKLHYTGHRSEVINCKDVYGYLEFNNVFPILQLLTLLPDYRFRMYRNNAFNKIVDALERVLSEIDSQLKKDPKTFEGMALELRNAFTSTTEDIKMHHHGIRCSHTVCGERPFCQCLYMTDLDRQLATLDKEETDNIVYRVKNILDLIPNLDTNNLETISKKTIKTILNKARDIVQDIRNIVLKAPEGWPDVVVWILSGGSRVAYTRISTADVIYSVASTLRGKDCGKIQTVYLKPVKCLMHTSSNCYCIAGKVELQLWMGLYREKSDFENFRMGYSIRGKGLEVFYKGSPQILELRVYIYRAKLRDCCGNSFVRVNAMNMVKESKVVSNTKAPIWNQLMRLQRTVYYAAERIRFSPPIVMIEVYATDNRSNQQLIGRTEIQPSFDEDLNISPSLQWHRLAKGALASGQIFMTVQIVEIPECVLKSTTYSPCGVQETCYDYNVPVCLQGENYVEPLPEYLIPKYTNYRIEVYWWGLREVNVCRKPCVVMEIEDVLIKSDVLSNSRTNCNFPNGIPTKYFETDSSELDCTPLTLKLYDNTTFGRTILLGMNVIHNHRKYIVDWLTKNERDSLLQTCRIVPANYIKVNEWLYVKKVLESRDDIKTNRSGSSMKKIITKISNMNCSKPLEGEQYSLLPVPRKRADDRDLTSHSIKNVPMNVKERGWWEKYHFSMFDYGDDVQPNRGGRITIYESELESQPEFSKFTDWCSAFGLYSDSGISDRDGRVCCAIVKVGIALYQWPPPVNTTAVDKCGVDLSYGYFQNFPKNNAEKIVVRVYVISGSCLQTNEMDTKPNPYVIVNCGRKQMGDRGDFVEGTCEPIFGKLYEFRCMLPEDYLLTLSVFDYDNNSSTDKLIGSTTIDLENRYYTKHRARVGLSTVYNGSGRPRWRDCIRPSQILEELCVDNTMQKPVFTDTSLIMNGIEYKYCETSSQYQSLVESRENACLDLLHKWQTLHLCGYRLVPEHVETRTLYNHNDTSKVSKGSIRMWVDIYPMDNCVYIPPPYNITYRKAEEYELRVEILKVDKLCNFHRHYQKTSTARVLAKAWLGNASNVQKTDIVFAKSTGEVPFHWRMIFQFKYQYADRKMLVESYDQLNWVKREDRVPPILHIVLVDVDRAGDEEIGYISVNLCSIPRGTSCVDICKYDVMHLADKLDLFSKGTVQGWWPLAAAEAREQMMSEAAIKMTLTVLPKEKAILMPVSVGRYPSNSIFDLRRKQSFLFENILTKLCLYSQQICLVFSIFVVVTVLLKIFYFSDSDNNLEDEIDWLRSNFHVH